MLTQDQIAAMERAMAEEHKKDREALERLRRFLPSSGGSPADGITRQRPATLSASLTTIRDSIADAIDERVGVDGEFTISTVLDLLKVAGVNLDVKRPESLLNKILKTFVDEGFAIMVAQAAGRRPARYRWKRRPDK